MNMHLACRQAMVIKMRKAFGKLLGAALLFGTPIMVSADKFGVSPAEYYSPDFAEALAAEQDMVQLLRLCKIRFPTECGKVGYPGYTEVEGLRRDLTRFRDVFQESEQRLKRASANVKTMADMTRILKEHAVHVRDRQLDYEIEFTARHLAVLDSCGSADEKKIFSVIIAINVRAFWDIRAEDMEGIERYFAEVQKNQADSLKNDEVYCRGVQKVGGLLANEMLVKLKNSEDPVEKYQFNYSIQHIITYIFMSAYILNQ
jgi:hypothetical protein